jgi:hypothetical protein
MDITTVSGASAFQQQKISSNVQASVAVKVLDAEKTEGAGALQLLQAASPQSGSEGSTSGSVDLRA